MTNAEAIEILSRPFDMENVPQDILEAHRMAISALEKQDELAADVVEVVRCRDCRYFYNGSMRCCTNHFGVVLTDENGFCHHAKRREDEGVTLDG